MSVTSATPVLSLLLLVASVRANFFLLASFGTYNNSLDSYETTDNDTCCYTQGNCSEKCGTILRYCFKEYGTVNNISDDENSALNCIEGTFRRAALSDPTEYIDYSTPPVDINSNTPTISTLTYQVADWPGELQFFVRSAVGEEIVEYFELDFRLNLGEPTLNATINGLFFPLHMTFTISLSLMCHGDYYGLNCSVYCHANESGYYTCNSDGSRECLPGYGGSSCDEDIICGHTDTCNHTEMCSNTGDGSFTCTPLPPQPTPTTQTPTTPSTSTSSSSSVVPLAAGVAAGVILLLLVLCVLALVVVVGLRKRMNTQTVDLKGNRDEEPTNDRSYGTEPGLGLLGNPMYEVGVRGTHLPLGKSPSGELGVEYDMDNPLYMMGAQEKEECLSAHNYDYPEDQTTHTVPSTGEEGGVYAEPDLVHPGPSPSLPPSHDYSEPDVPPPPGALYDDTVLPESKKIPINHHYETADVVIETSNQSHTIYDSENEDM